MRSIGLIVSLVMCVAVIACSGGAAATNRPSLNAPSIAIPSIPAAPSAGVPASGSGSGSKPSAEQLCGLLTANDWATINLSRASSQPTMNTDGPGSAYCTYSGASGATGGLEFDAFVDDNATEAEETFATIADQLPGGQPADLPGVDVALINPDVDGTYGAIIVRNGRFTYTISLPASDGAQTQLQTLALLVATRAQQYK